MDTSSDDDMVNPIMARDFSVSLFLSIRITILFLITQWRKNETANFLQWVHLSKWNLGKFLKSALPYIRMHVCRERGKYTYDALVFQNFPMVAIKGVCPFHMQSGSWNDSTEMSTQKKLLNVVKSSLGSVIVLPSSLISHLYRSVKWSRIVDRTPYVKDK